MMKSYIFSLLNIIKLVVLYSDKENNRPETNENSMKYKLYVGKEQKNNIENYCSQPKIGNYFSQNKNDKKQMIEQMLEEYKLKKTKGKQKNYQNIDINNANSYNMKPEKSDELTQHIDYSLNQMPMDSNNSNNLKIQENENKHIMIFEENNPSQGIDKGSEDVNGVNH